jgi:hypothetical protein
VAHGLFGRLARKDRAHEDHEEARKDEQRGKQDQRRERHDNPLAWEVTPE